MYRNAEVFLKSIHPFTFITSQLELIMKCLIFLLEKSHFIDLYTEKQKFQVCHIKANKGCN